MNNSKQVSKQRRSTIIGASLLVAVAAVFVVVQVIFAANAAPAVSQSGTTAVAQDGDVITGTSVFEPAVPVDLEADDALGEYLRAHTTYYSENDAKAVRAAADLSGSTKSVDWDEAPAGASLNYTIIISNNSGIGVNDLLVTDTLPADLAYQPNSYQSDVSLGYTSSEFDGITYNGAITWTGSLGPSGQVTLTFGAVLTDSLAVDDVVTNIVEIDDAGTVITREASTTIVEETFSPYTFLPVIYKTLLTPIVQVNHPNDQNQWTVSWTNVNEYSSGFEIYESQDPSFNTILSTRIVAGNVTSSQYQHSLSTKNEYYYRVRALGQGGNVTSPWSNTASVIGGYYDDFSNPDTGWAIRRTTYLEEVRSWYERNGTDYWFILQVEDSWDWGVAAPFKTKAPKPPYAIEYRTQMAHKGNLVSHGLVFGADWPGGGCPDYSWIGGIYWHNICFNHFYNTNIIWYGPMKLLFERVDYLEWRPNDGGSPLKRGHFDDFDNWTVSKIPNVNSEEWNTFKVEVRESGIKLFANGQEYASTPDNLWVNEPYFGLFASTDEYSNSTWRFDYYKITPLNN